MAKKVQYTTNTPSSTTDYLAADNTWKAMTGGGGGVPYTGATANVDLGEYGLDTGFVSFDTTPTSTPTTQGTMSWDTDHNTVQLVMNGTTGRVLEDVFYIAKNQTGSTIPKGTVVRADGTLGASGRIKIAPFLADGTYPSEYLMGVTAEAILDGEDGMVVHFGQIRNVNTSAYTDGDILYASTTSAGAFTTTQPTAPNNIIEVAIVIHAASNGVLQVRPTIGSNINSDEGVLITTPSNGQVLTYNSTSGLWENQTPSGGSSASHYYVVGSTIGLAAGVTRYGNVAGTTAESQVRVPVPSACTISDLYVRTTGTMNALASLRVAVYKNATITAVSVTIAGGSAAGTYSNTANSVTLAAGDGWVFGYTNAGTLAAAASSGQSVKITI
jgi:hypothetical protein